MENNQNEASTVQENENKSSLSDIGNLIMRIGHGISGIKQTATELFNNIADDEYRKICRPVLTIDSCLKWIGDQKSIYHNAKFFLISYVKTPAPRNENDIFSVTLALLDANKNPIPISSTKKPGLFSREMNGQNLVCIVIPTKTFDQRLLQAFNGESAAIIEL